MQFKFPHQVQSINNELLKMNYFDEIDDIYYTSLLRKKVIKNSANYNFLGATSPTRRELPLLDFYLILKLLL